MKTRRSLAAAVLVSFLVHGAAGWALTRLGSDANVSSPPAEDPLPVTHVLLPRLAEIRGKLAPGDEMTTGPDEPLLPPAPAFMVSVAVTPGAPLGPQLVEIPGELPGVKAAAVGASVPSGGGSSGATTTFFGISARGQSIVYLLDRSCSMGFQGALVKARRELLASLQCLPANARFQVVLYNSSPQPLLGRHDELLPATPENLRRAVEAVQLIEPEGSTQHCRGFEVALYLHPDVLYFLTDGDDLTDGEERTILKLNAGRTVIHTIELTLSHQGRPEMPMQRLARATGGSYRAVDLSAPR